MPTLSEVIANYRETHDNMSVRKLAAKCGVSHGYISLLEKTNAIDVKMPTLKKLAEGMDMDVKELMNLIGYTNSDTEIEDPTNLSFESQSGLIIHKDDEVEIRLLKEYKTVKNNKEYVAAKYLVNGQPFDTITDEKTYTRQLPNKAIEEIKAVVKLNTLKESLPEEGKKELLGFIEHFNTLPEEGRKELLNFIEFLSVKYNKSR